MLKPSAAYCRASKRLCRASLVQSVVLAESIAFERATRKKLNPTKFAVYSALCTWADFIAGNDRIRMQISDEHADLMIRCIETDWFSDKFWEVCIVNQWKLWGRTVISRRAKVSREEIHDLFYMHLSNLSDIKLAQYVLMHGMYKVDPISMLATLTGYNSFESCIELVTGEVSPESSAEQEVRADFSFIEFIGIGE